MHRLVDKIQEGLNADHIIMALSDYREPNWRLEVYPTYKMHRGFKRRPILWQELRDYIRQTFPWEQLPGLEGDDVIGLYLTEPSEDERICVSLDKDMHTLPGQHIHMQDAIDFDDGDLYPLVYEVTEEEADQFHMLQALMGDQTDGYSGCPGFGAVTAERLLDAGMVLEPTEHTFSRGKRKGETETRWVEGDPGTPWEIIVSAYESKGLSEEDALSNARVARILRYGEYDEDTGEVKLWTPKEQ